MKNPKPEPLPRRLTPLREVPALRKHRVFLALAEDFAAVDEFFAYAPKEIDSFRERIARLAERRGFSESLVLTFSAFNESMEAGEASVKNLARLGQGDAFAVVASMPAPPQEGPAETLFKCATIVALSRHLEEAGVGRFVPVLFLDPGGLRREEGEDPSPSVQVSKEAVPFGRALQQTVPDWGIVLGSVRFLRPEGLTLFEQELLDPSGIHEILVETGERLAARGYPAPFSASGPPNLVFEDEIGTPVKVNWDGEAFRLGETEVEAFDLLSRLERLAPTAVLEPLLVDMALPVAAMVAGPGEGAQHAQRGGLYGYYGLPDPLVFPALCASVPGNRTGEEAWTDVLDKMGIPSPEALLASIDVFDFRQHVFG
ncbi:MAG: bacillithiol biosynthesis protein BshC [Planctomycetota bacterium]